MIWLHPFCLVKLRHQWYLWYLIYSKCSILCISTLINLTGHVARRQRGCLLCVARDAINKNYVTCFVNEKRLYIYTATGVPVSMRNVDYMWIVLWSRAQYLVYSIPRGLVYIDKRSLMAMVLTTVTPIYRHNKDQNTVVKFLAGIVLSFDGWLYPDINVVHKLTGHSIECKSSSHLYCRNHHKLSWLLQLINSSF